MSSRFNVHLLDQRSARFTVSTHLHPHVHPHTHTSARGHSVGLELQLQVLTGCDQCRAVTCGGSGVPSLCSCAGGEPGCHPGRSPARTRDRQAPGTTPAHTWQPTVIEPYFIIHWTGRGVVVMSMTQSDKVPGWSTQWANDLRTYYIRCTRFWRFWRFWR